MIRLNRVEHCLINYIMLSGRCNPYPTPPPTLYFSVTKGIPALCPPIF